MNRKLVVFTFVMALAMVVVASCQNDPEDNRAVVTVSSINNNAPFFSDVLEQGDTLFVGGAPFTQDDFVEEDFIPVIFHNRPFHSFVTTGPGQPFNDFLITRYRVEWRRADGGLVVLPTYDGATSVMVPSNELVTASFLLVPFEQKNGALLSAINYLGLNFPDEILMIARLTFWGHETGSDREWFFTAEVSVDFADPVVKSQ
ncbi:MAG: hypothetical protein ACE5EO_06040 [Candidatus Krumholzibacteriia bacterium]